MLLSISSMLLLAAPCTQPRSQASPHSVADHTGIEWTFPFKAAQEKARRENRILMVKPIAFGTTRDGSW